MQPHFIKLEKQIQIPVMISKIVQKVLSLIFKSIAEHFSSIQYVLYN